MNDKQIVDFMIIGAMKSGTTSLAHYLSMHPEVCFCEQKEPGFFNQNIDWRNEIEGYHKLYKPNPGEILGEASTMYTMLPEHTDTHIRLKEYNPDLKLIYIMRDPIERISSNYAHNLVRKRVRKDLRSEILGNPAYVDRSRYFYQIKPYLDTFSRDQILLLFFEDFVKKPQHWTQEVARFIGISDSYYSSYEHFDQKNASTNRPILADGGLGKIFSPLKKYRSRIPESLISFGLLFFGNRLESNPELPIDLRRELYQRIHSDISEMEDLMGRKTPWKKYL